MLLFLAMYQGKSLADTLKIKDFKLLAGIEDVDRLMTELSERYDTSGLGRLLVMTALKEEKIELEVL